MQNTSTGLKTLKIISAIVICICLLILGIQLFFVPEYHPRASIHAHLLNVEKCLSNYYAHYKEYPDNDKGLMALNDEKFKRYYCYLDKYELSAYYYGRVSTLERFVYPSESGIMSPWHMPYIYENRNGLDPALFEFSPMNEPDTDKYGIKISDGIYVYSAIEYKRYKEFKEELRTFHIINILLGVVVLAFMALYITVSIKTKSFRPFKFSLLVLLPLFVPPLSCMAVSEIFRATCYAPAPIEWDKGRLPIYKEFLEKYRSAGIIKDATYEKILQGIDNDYKKRDEFLKEEEKNNLTERVIREKENKE